MDASVLVYRCRSKAGGAPSRATISFGTYVRNVSVKGLPSGDGNQFDSAMSATGFGPTAIFKEPSDSFCSGRMVVQVEALQRISDHAIIRNAHQDHGPVRVNHGLRQAVGGEMDHSLRPSR